MDPAAQLAALLAATATEPGSAPPRHETSTVGWPPPAAPTAPEMNPAELDAWLQHHLDSLATANHAAPDSLASFSQAPPFVPQPEPAPVPAQPHAFPPISSSRFHPYDRPQRQQQQPSLAARSAPSPWSTTTIPDFSTLPMFAPVKQPVLYPPEDSPAPIILSNVASPRSMPSHSAFPTPTSSHAVKSPTTVPMSLSDPAAPRRPRKRRTRSMPTLSSRETDKNDVLDSLFTSLDDERWNLSNLMTALSDPAPDRTTSHRRRIEEFLHLETNDPFDVGQPDSWSSRLRRWKRERGVSDKGADEIVRLWEEQGGLGRQTREKGMEDAVNELRLNVHEGPVTGLAIRHVINRYHEAYNGSQADIAVCRVPPFSAERRDVDRLSVLQRIDAALSRPPSPHLSSAPREPEAWSGTLVVPPTQADLLSFWLMSPGRPNLQEERAKGGIEAEHMRIYSSLSPLVLHARGSEICRAILARDEATRAQFGLHWDSLHKFSTGPSIAPIDTGGFASFDDYSLWHHALMCYLQLCVRYPSFQESKDAHIVVAPDLPPPVHPTPLETSLIDRLLKSHWDYLRLYLLNEHGGLLRSAVRGFEGVRLSKYDLLSVVGDTMEVIEALKKSRDSSDRILPYDPSVSQIRNAWRQRAFWDPQASWVVWSAATTHFLELSALNKEWASGVRDLPGVESLLTSTSKSASQHALR
ncbi:hypothetical protein JCM10212_005095 [Sporobolomyces blumeae]